MTANIDPIFPVANHNGFATLAAQVGTPAGTGTLVDLILAADNTEGMQIHTIEAVPLGTNVASSLLIYVLRSGDATPRLRFELSLPATTATSGSVVPSRAIGSLPPLNQPVGGNGILLAAGEGLKCALSTAVAAGYNVWAMAGKY